MYLTVVPLNDIIFIILLFLQKPFTWDAQTRGWVLSAFYYGYITTPFLGGWLEHRFGGKIVFGLAIFLSSLITLIMPSISYISPWALVAARIALGIVQVSFSHHTSLKYLINGENVGI